MFGIKKIDITNAKLLCNAMADCIESFSLPVIERLVADNRTWLLIALDENTAIGYVLAYTFPSLNDAGSLAYLYDIEVVPAYRRKGVGKKLIEELLALLQSEGVTEIWLGTATNNHAGQALFTATGAERSGETFNDYTYVLVD